MKKNHSFHTVNKYSPFKAVFGIDTPLGFTSTTIPVEEWSKLESAKQLFDAVGYEYSPDEIGDEDDEEDGQIDIFDPKEYELLDLVNQTQCVVSEATVETPASIETAANLLLGIRENVRQNQKKTS